MVEIRDISFLTMPTNSWRSSSGPVIESRRAVSQSAALALQWFTKIKYAIEYPVIYTYGCMVLSDKAWARLSADDQKIVDEVFDNIVAEFG